MRAFFKNLFALLIGLLIAVGVLEVAANAFVYFGLNVSRSEYIDYYEKNPNVALLTWMIPYKPHPYFGYENQAIRIFERSEFDRSKDFVVGILGGSVAMSLGDYLRDHTQHFDILRPYVPNLGTKEVVVANLALGGGKQPQQFIMSTYFIEKFDMIINVDGFNDASPVNFLPAYPLDFPYLSLRYLERSKRGRIYATVGRAARWSYIFINRLPIRHLPVLAHSSLYFAFWYVTDPMLFKLLQILQHKFQEEAVIVKEGAVVETEPPQAIMEKMVGIWKKYTEMQFRYVSELYEKPIFFFVQPNQYVQGSKPLSQEEKAIAIDADKIDIERFRMEEILDGYRDLKKSGVPIYDLTSIYNQTDEIVYRDSCCHVNSLGNRIMAESIMATIKEHYEGRQAP